MTKYPIHKDEQGRWVHTWVRQSSIKTADMCMERLRNEMFNLVESPNNDGADLGTACHSAAEDVIKSMMGGSTIMSLLDTYEALDYYWEILAEEVDNWHSYGDSLTAHLMGRQKIKSWYENVLPMITDPQGVEVDFNKILIEDDERVVYLRGTIDLVELGLWVFHILGLALCTTKVGGQWISYVMTHIMSGYAKKSLASADMLKPIQVHTC